MKQRILVAVVGVPLLLAVLVAAPDWATAILVSLLSIVGAHELLTAVCGVDKTRRWFWVSATMGVALVWMVYGQAPQFMGTSMETVSIFFCFVLTALVVGAFMLAVAEYGGAHTMSFTDICAVLVAGFVIPGALSCLLRLRLLPDGNGLVMIPLVAAFCSDTMALFAGMACGKHKLSPKVSPKKTVEGAIGGLLGGMLGMLIFRVIFQLCTLRPLNILWCLLLGLLGAAMGQLGDLSFSLIKRQYGIKDYGRLLPGHGGVLDRFDSVIFTAPIVWIIMSYVTL